MARNTCGTEKPAASIAVVAAAAATMNKALTMLLAAMVRARLSASLRLCRMAYSGTL